jgi:predicted O-methyltransferase YrrM
VFEGLGALSTVNNLQVLRALMLERRPRRTLEIGLGFGASALATRTGTDARAWDVPLRRF